MRYRTRTTGSDTSSTPAVSRTTTSVSTRSRRNEPSMFPTYTWPRSSVSSWCDTFRASSARPGGVTVSATTTPTSDAITPTTSSTRTRTTCRIRTAGPPSG